MLIDSHVNLHHAAYDADREAVIAAARAAGVGRMITICDRLDNVPAIKAVCAGQDDITMSVGVHPHHAKDFPGLSVEDLIRLASDPKVCAIGETGLDRHYNYSPFAEQLTCFETHLEAAGESRLPIIVHTREADEETGDALSAAAHRRSDLRILMHCYTSGMGLARRAWDLGAYMSFSGIMTFKSAEDVREVAREAPLDRVLLETDCPYLAPIPFRGRRNEPSMVAEVYAAFAQLRGLTRAALEDRVLQNFERLFARAAP